MKFDDFLSHLSNYEPGEDTEVIAGEYGVEEVIKLASNENPPGAPPKTVKVLQENAFKANLYPDDSVVELKGELAQKYNVKNKSVIIDTGSGQVIGFAIHSKLNPQNAFLQVGVSFVMYEIYTKQCSAKCYRTRNITHGLSEFKTLYEAHKNEIEITFLCLPSNPLGERLDANEVFEFMHGIDENCLVVIDAVYNKSANFKDQNKYLKPYDLIQEFKNVLYSGTFPKLYGLDGLRIDYGIVDTEIISAFYKLRAPFNMSNLALKAAVTTLYNEKFARKALGNDFFQMKLYKGFAKKHRIRFIESYTNSITYFLGEKNSTDLSEKLLKKGIITRNLKSYGLDTMRITIGTPYENGRFFTEFEGILR